MVSIPVLYEDAASEFVLNPHQFSRSTRIPISRLRALQAAPTPEYLALAWLLSAQGRHALAIDQTNERRQLLALIDTLKAEIKRLGLHLDAALRAHADGAANDPAGCSYVAPQTSRAQVVKIKA